MKRQRFILLLLICVLLTSTLFWFLPWNDEWSYVGTYVSVQSSTITPITATESSTNVMTDNEESISKGNENDNDKVLELDDNEIVGGNWVVMTLDTSSDVMSESSSPTAVVELLNNSFKLLHHWNFVIILLYGKNSPATQNINYQQQLLSSNISPRPKHVHILDNEAQERLGYRVTKHLPSDSYARKNIGYLYAMHRGAKQILDLDAGMQIPQHYSLVGIAGSKNSSSEGSSTLPHIAESGTTPSWIQKPYYLLLNQVKNNGNLSQDMSLALSSVVNPLQFFYGTDSHYDAHYPHDIRALNKKYSQRYLVKMHPSLLAERRISIFQGIVHLTNDTEYPRSNEYSVVAPPGTMVPFHSRNSIFLDDAFWALLVPTVHEPCRPYIIQKLLWELGSHIQFTDAVVNASETIPTFKFLRDEHENTAHDECISLVMKWVPRNQSSDLLSMLSELYSHLELRGRMQSSAVKLLHAWIKDLERIGYRPPIRSKPRSLDTSSINFSYQSVLSLVQQRSTTMRLHKIRDNVLLIMNFNHEFYRLIPMLEKMYMDTFPHRVYVGPETRQVGSVYVRGFNTNGGHFSYLGYRAVLQEFPNFDGYLITNDDVIMNTGNWVDHEESKIWVSAVVNYCTLSKSYCDHWYARFYSQIKEWYHKLPKYLQDRVHSNALALAPNEVHQMDRVHVVKTHVDVFYLPQKTIAEFVQWTGVMNDVWLEIGEATLMYAMDEASNLIFLNDMYLWGDDRALGNVAKKFREKHDFVHAFKWGAPGALSLGYQLLEEQLCIFQRVNKIE